MQRIISVLVVLTIPLLLAAGNDDVRKELKALQGTWKALALEAGGKLLPKEAGQLFEVALGKVIARERRGRHGTSPKRSLAR